ncbi:MAG: hypothetical protein HY289_15100 [Planctomycetes bacterium]|nr:hypothetical protein [Planctomycetota bacterium]
MLRALLTIVLTSLVALPQGVCFCHYVEAAPACHGDSSQPSDDHDDADCPCKLREVLAIGPAPAGIEVDGASVLDVPVPDARAVAAAACDRDSSPLCRSADCPFVLIPCALRI